MLTQAVFATTVKRGIQNANKLSRRLRYLNLDEHGAEYLLVVETARALAQVHRGYVDVEVPPKEVLEGYGKTRGPLPRALRHNGRIDIVVSDKAEKKRIILEIKKDANDIRADVRRVAQILRRSGVVDIRYGAVAFVRVLRPDQSRAPKEKVRRICEELEDEIAGIKININEPSKTRCPIHDENIIIVSRFA